MTTFANVEGSSRATPSLESQVIDVAEYETIIVDPITSALLNQLDSDFVAGNIKNGVDLFGLMGTMEAGTAQKATGTWTSTEDKVITSENPVTIPLGLSFTPDCLIFFQQNYDASSAPSNKYEYVGCALFRVVKGTGKGMAIVNIAKSSKDYYQSLSGFSSSTPSALATYNFKAVSFKVLNVGSIQPANAIILAGKTYTWIAFGEK